MPKEGEITVRLRWDGHRVSGVDVRSTRPFAATRLLAGKTPGAVAALVPSLFAICGGAQGAAAASALAAAGARDIAVAPAEIEREVALETVQEHFWRLLIDWPRALGEEPDAPPVAAVRRRIAALLDPPEGRPAVRDATAMRTLGAELSQQAAQSIYGIAPALWLSGRGIESLQTWTARGATACARLLGRMLAEMPAAGRSDVPLMPAVERGELLATVVPAMDREPSFARAPTWDGAPRETGPLARTCRHPLVAPLVARDGHTAAARMAARLVDLALLLGRLAGTSRSKDAARLVTSLSLNDHEGVAAVQTARGLLVHRVRLADGRVTDYSIVAPTEWNFHPVGALARGLAGTTADSEDALRRSAQVAVQALDPCVGCRIEIGHA
jgi:hypothetical protein